MQSLSENIISIKKSDIDFVKKCEYEFCNNNMVNDDFFNYLKFLKNRDWLFMGAILEKMENKTRIFYMKSEYKQFNELVNAFNKIRNFYFKWKYPIYKQKSTVNDFNLMLLPINQIKNVISLTIKDSIYRFSADELLSIYKFSLKSVDGSFHYNQQLIPPKNPYTNIRFSLKENLILFDQLNKHLFSIGKNMPSYLTLFKECYFNLMFYTRLNINSLSLISVNKYVDNMNYADFMIEFNEIIEYRSIKKIYCKHCYKRHDLYKIFKQTVVYYLLNSNDIYIFGNYIISFLKTAKLNNLIYDKSHQSYHRIKLRRKKRYKSTNSQTNNHPSSIINSPSQLIINIPYNNEDIVTEEFVQNSSTSENVVNVNNSTNENNINSQNISLISITKSIVDDLINETVLRFLRANNNPGVEIAESYYAKDSGEISPNDELGTDLGNELENITEQIVNIDRRLLDVENSVFNI
jgi:hypothetical protein